MKNCKEVEENKNVSSGWGKTKLKKQEKVTSVIKEKDWYKKKIIEMVSQIENEKFLRRIYIIVSDNKKEKPE